MSAALAITKIVVRFRALHRFSPPLRTEGRLVKIFVQDKARRRRRICYTPRRRNAVLREKIYQDAFLTPGIWPLYASSRKQIRQMP